MKHFILIHLIYILALSANAQTQLTLEQCLASAKVHNRTLQNAALDIQASSEQRKEAFTNYFPQISANVMAFQAFDKVVKNDGIIPQEIAVLGEQFYPLIGQPYSIRELNKGYTATMSIMQPIFAGGKILNGNKLARIQEDVNILQHQLKEKDVMQKVTENYWQIAVVKYNLQTIDAAQRQLEEVHRQVELFVSTGVATRNNILKVNLALKELESNRIRLQNADRLLRLLLAQQIGMVNEDIDIVLPNEDESVISPEQVHITSIDAAAKRTEVQMASKGVEAQRLQIRMERADLLPTLAVGLMGYHSGFGGFSEEAKPYITKNMTNALVMGTLSIPISKWWGGSHAIRRQKIKLQQSQNTLIEAREMLQIDIESAWINLTEAYKQIEIAESTVAESAENLRMSTDQYRVGKETLSDLLDAETMHRKSQDLLSQARATYQIRLADYLRKTR